MIVQCDHAHRYAKCEECHHSSPHRQVLEDTMVDYCNDPGRLCKDETGEDIAVICVKVKKP